MPMYNWEKVHKGEYNFVLHSPVPLNRWQKSYCVKVWEKIYESYISRFGFSENYLHVLRKKKQIAKLQVKKILSGDRTIEPLIAVAKLELEKMQKDTGGMDFFEATASLSKALGFPINPKQTTVAEYFSYVKSVSKSSHGRR